MFNFNNFPSWLVGDELKKKEYQYLNSIEYQNVFFNLVNSWLDIFEFGGVPIGVSERTILYSYLFRGFCCLFKEEGHYLALPAAPSCECNANGDWLYANVYGSNGFNKNIKLYLPGITENPYVEKGISGLNSGGLYSGVLGRINATGYPPIYNIMLSSKRLANVSRAMDTAVETMKVPYIIKTDESLVNSIKSMYSKIKENEPIIISTKTLGLDSLEVINTNINTNTISEFREQYEFLQGCIYSELGIKHNAEPDKNAHILEAELHSEDEATGNSINKQLTYLKKWCEDCNEAFGLSMNVKIRNRSITMDELEDFENSDNSDNLGVEDENTVI